MMTRRAGLPRESAGHHTHALNRVYPRSLTVLVLTFSSRAAHCASHRSPLSTFVLGLRALELHAAQANLTNNNARTQTKYISQLHKHTSPPSPRAMVKLNQLAAAGSYGTEARMELVRR